MSGPKCDSYEVVRNRALEEAARVEELGRARWAAEELQEAERLVRERLGDAALTEGPGALPAGGDAAALRTWTRQARARADALRAAVRAAETEARVQRALASATAHATGSAVRAQQAPRTPATTGADPVEPDRADEARRVAGRLPGTASDAEREEVLALVGRAADDAAALLALRHAVQRVTERAAARTRDADQAAQLVEQLAGLTGADVDAARADLIRVAAGDAALTDDLVARCTRTAAAARARADAGYALSATADVLRELGYQVEVDLTTDVPADRRLVARRAADAAHEVRVRLNGEHGELTTHLVRRRAGADLPAEAAHDLAAEQAWCGDHAALVDGLEEAGVDLRAVRHRLPGELPVPRVLDAPAAAQGSSQRIRRTPPRHRYAP